MNRLPFLFFLLASPFFLLAQDTIAFKAGGKIPAIVISSKGDTIKYWTQGSVVPAKVHKVLSWNVSYIRYQDGTMQSFGITPNTVSSSQVFVKGGYGVCSDVSIQERAPTIGGFTVSAGYTGKHFGHKNRMGLEFGLGYIQKGGVIRMNGTPLYLASNNSLIGDSYGMEGVRLGYLNGDVLFRFYLSRVCYVKAGLEMGYLLHYSGVTEQDVTPFSGPLKDPYTISDFKRFSAGAEYGLGIASTGKKAGIFAEILVQNDGTDIGLIPPKGFGEDAILYHNRCVFFHAGVFFNLSRTP